MTRHILAGLYFFAQERREAHGTNIFETISRVYSIPIDQARLMPI